MKLFIQYHSGREPTVSICGAKKDMESLAKEITEGIVQLDAKGRDEGCLVSAIPAEGDAVEYLELHAVGDVESLCKKNQLESKRKAVVFPLLIVLALVTVYFAYKGIAASIR